ncbi:hypothetical protein [Neisseria elongata]|uniref:hypothetical protein n=1 Tax=Neisseria elongata TaxID=495 RepID=UPI0028D87960|nr:hypothetical protein [Neisseria elongata]
MVVVFNDLVEAATVRLGEAVCGWRDFTGGVGWGAVIPCCSSAQLLFSDGRLVLVSQKLSFYAEASF